MIITCKKLQLLNMSKVLLTFILAIIMMASTNKADAQKAYAALNGSTLTFYFDTKQSTHGTTYELNTDNNEPEWKTAASTITKVVFHDSFAGYSPLSCAYWFASCTKLTEIQNIKNLKTEKVKSFKSMFHTCSNLPSVDVSGFNTSSATDMSAMFKNCVLFTSLNLKNFDTKNVTDFSSFFEGCIKLQELDLSSFDTKKVTSMAGMFLKCAVLSKLDISSFVTNEVTNMRYLFSDCYDLTSLDLSHFNTAKVTNMDRMFLNCGFTYVILGEKFNTSEVTIADCMFCQCKNLTTIFAHCDFVFPDDVSCASMFKDCPKLKGGQGTVYDVNQASTKDIAQIDKGTSSPGYFTKLILPQANALIYTGQPQELVTAGSIEGGLKLVYRLETTNGYVSNIPTATDAGIYKVYYKIFGNIYPEKVITVNIAKAKSTITKAPVAVGTLVYTGEEQSLVVAGTVSMGKIVYSLDGTEFSETIPTGKEVKEYTVYYKVNETDNYLGTEVASLKVSISDIKPYTVLENGTLTFYFDTNPNTHSKTYDLNNGDDKPAWNAKADSITTVVFDASFADFKPLSCAYWFASCKNLTEIKNIENLNTENVSTFKSMFHTCTNLKSVDVSGFNTSYATDMDAMFKNCSSFTTLDLSKFDTKNVTTIGSFLEGCVNLVELDLSSFDTQNIKSMGNMFLRCYSLSKLDISSFVTDNVTNMRYMFAECYKLASLDLSHFNTANVTNMDRMFYNNRVTYIILGENFKTDKVEIMNCMFDECRYLTTIAASNDFVIGTSTSHTSMFEGCNKLKGGEGTTYSFDNASNAAYAIIDKGESAPGYFTNLANFEIKPPADTWLKQPDVNAPSLVYSGEPLELVAPGEALYGKVLYSLDGKIYSEEVPTATEPGTYTVYYKVETTENFQGIEPQTLTITIDGGITPVSSISTASTISVWAASHTIFISNAPIGTEYKIIDIQGRLIKSAKTKSTREEICINKNGVVVVVISGKAFKVAN